MKALFFSVCLTVGLLTLSTDAVAQQDTQKGSVTSAKKEKAKKAGTESDEVVSSSPMAAQKKRNIQRPANNAPATSGSVMSAGKSPRESR